MARRDGTIRADDVYPVAEACGQIGRAGALLPPAAGRRRAVHPGGRGPRRRLPLTERGSHFWTGHLDRHRLAYAQDRPGGAGTAAGTSSPSPSPRPSGPPATPSGTGCASSAALRSRAASTSRPTAGRTTSTAEADRLGVADHVTLAITDDLEVGGESDPRALAGRSGTSTTWPSATRRSSSAYAGRARGPRGHAGPPRAPDRRRVPGRRPGHGRRLPGGLRATTRCCRPSCSPARGPAARPASSWRRSASSASWPASTTTARCSSTSSTRSSTTSPDASGRTGGA